MLLYPLPPAEFIATGSLGFGDRLYEQFQGMRDLVVVLVVLDVQIVESLRTCHADNR